MQPVFRSGRSFRLAFVLLILAATALPLHSARAQEREELLRLRAQQICMSSLSRNFQKIARTGGQNIFNCLREETTGELLGGAEACIASDPRGREARMRLRLLEDAADRCIFPLDFGPADPNDVDRAASALSLGIVHEILDADLDGGVLDTAIRDRTKPRCQLLVLRSVSRNIDSRLRSYSSCKRAGLRDGSITTSAELEPCVSADERGNVASANLRLDRDIGIYCVNRLVPLDDAFPACGATDSGVLRSCIVERVACGICLALNEADGLSSDCDLIDDGAVNTSCE